MNRDLKREFGIELAKVLQFGSRTEQREFLIDNRDEIIDYYGYGDYLYLGDLIEGNIEYYR